MPLSFTPKFVDMVRVASTTQGTGPLTCGAAVQGFASFAESLSVGDNFYYSIQGVDRPQEREVGRGTLQANGTISRQPIRGGLTNFSAGQKVIALVTASEWFEAVSALTVATDQLGKSNSRAELAALPATAGSCRYLSEAGREGMFVFVGENIAPLVSTDSRQAMIIASPALPDGSAGGWIRKVDQGLNVRWFGAIGDNVADDGAAFLAALAYMRATAQVGFGYSTGGGRLFVPKGKYFLGTSTLDLFTTVHLVGENGIGDSGGPASVLRWSAGATGIRVQTHNTTGANGVRTSGDRGDASLIENLFLQGGFTSTEGEFHGIQLRGRATIRQCFIENFQGDAVHIQATAGAGDGNFEGNANCFHIDKIFVQGCRNGIFTKGADANAGNVIGASINYCRQWGVWESSFLGNNYSGLHVAENGELTGFPTQVSYLNNRFTPQRLQEVAASTTTPPSSAVDTPAWIFVEGGGADSAHPGWVSGMAVRTGGAYRTDGDSARNVFTGCYSESGEGPSQFNGPSLVLGGLHGAGIKGSVLNDAYGGELRGNQVGLIAARDLAVNGTLSASSAVIGPSSGAAADSQLFVDHTNFNSYLTFRSWAAGVATIIGSVQASRNFGFLWNVTAGRAHRVRIADVDIAIIDSAGIELGSGKVLRVNGQQIVGSRDTGWTAATGSGSKGTFAASPAGTASAAYTQSELQSALNRVAALEARVVSYDAALRSHGLIG